MDSIAEKRIYGDRTGARDAYVASETGLVRVRVAGDAVGEFSLVDRRSARDVAAGPVAAEARTDGSAVASLAVATNEDVLFGAVVGDPGADGGSSGPVVLEATGFGPAAAVGFGPDGPVAASPDGDVREYGEDGWRAIDGPGELDVRAIDGDLVGTDRGVYRLDDRRLRSAGLEDVRDVDTTATPLAATGSGLFALGNGWMCTLEAAADAIEVGPAPDSGGGDRGYAAAGTTLYASEPGDGVAASPGADGEDSWRTIATADEPIAGIGSSESGYVYAVTTAGTVLAVGPDGTRARSIGVRAAAAIAVC